MFIAVNRLNRSHSFRSARSLGRWLERVIACRPTPVDRRRLEMALLKERD